VKMLYFIILRRLPNAVMFEAIFSTVKDYGM